MDISSKTMKNHRLYGNYDRTRFSYTLSRTLVWIEISRYLQKYINKKSKIVDLGSGYCDFINKIKGSKKYAFDKYIDPSKFISNEVEPIFGDFRLLDKKIKNGSIDVFFASNFFEHLNDVEMEKCISLIIKKLRIGGILIALQPNYKLCYSSYFDDFTHVKAWSHISLRDFLNSRGLRVIKEDQRFLPLSMKSRIPKHRLLVRLYLNMPFKPFAKQMLIIARKKQNVEK